MMSVPKQPPLKLKPVVLVLIERNKLSLAGGRVRLNKFGNIYKNINELNTNFIGFIQNGCMQKQHLGIHALGPLRGPKTCIG